MPCYAWNVNELQVWVTSFSCLKVKLLGFLTSFQAHLEREKEINQLFCSRPANRPRWVADVGASLLCSYIVGAFEWKRETDERWEKRRPDHQHVFGVFVAHRGLTLLSFLCFFHLFFRFCSKSCPVCGQIEFQMMKRSTNSWTCVLQCQLYIRFGVVNDPLSPSWQENGSHKPKNDRLFAPAFLTMDLPKMHRPSI